GVNAWATESHSNWAPPDSRGLAESFLERFEFRIDLLETRRRFEKLRERRWRIQRLSNQRLNDRFKLCRMRSRHNDPVRGCQTFARMCRGGGVRAPDQLPAAVVARDRVGDFLVADR